MSDAGAQAQLDTGEPPRVASEHVEARRTALAVGEQPHADRMVTACGAKQPARDVVDAAVGLVAMELDSTSHGRRLGNAARTDAYVRHPVRMPQ